MIFISKVKEIFTKAKISSLIFILTALLNPTLLSFWCRIAVESDSRIDFCNSCHVTWPFSNKATMSAFTRADPKFRYREQVVQLFATRCRSTSLSSVILLGFAALTFCVASQWLFIFVRVKCYLRFSYRWSEVTTNLRWVLFQKR
jgi:hypothetical protein